VVYFHLYTSHNILKIKQANQNMPTLSALAFDKANLLLCEGYFSDFIDKNTKVSIDNILDDSLKDALPDVEGNKKRFLHYTDFSVLYNAHRKVPFLSAYNINGADKSNQAARPEFRRDPRIRKEIQLNKDFYNLRKDITEFEIGHMASNNEMGRGANGKLKAYQTFHFTNSAPQAEVLNTGLWKGLETYIIDEASTVKGNKKICVFTGPVLNNKDPQYVRDTNFRIPLLFFKVIVFLTPKGLFSTAFVISHEKKMIEDKMFAIKPRVRGIRPAPGITFFNDYPYKEVFQINIPLLENLTGLNFSWKGVNKVIVPEQKRLIEKIKGIKNAKDAKEEMKGRRTRSIAPRNIIPEPGKLNIVLP
jgi:DNA/RNA endonuclease G (NUC1)